MLKRQEEKAQSKVRGKLTVISQNQGRKWSQERKEKNRDVICMAFLAGS